MRAAARPRVVATVVRPTPPLPRTTTRRLSSSRLTGRNLPHPYEYAEAHGSFPAPIRRNRTLGVISDGVPKGEGHRLRKPEGRGREDDDDAEPRGRLRGERAPRPLRRHGPSGQPDHVTGHRSGFARVVDVRRARAAHPD